MAREAITRVSNRELEDLLTYLGFESANLAGEHKTFKHDGSVVVLPPGGPNEAAPGHTVQAVRRTLEDGGLIQPGEFEDVIALAARKDRASQRLYDQARTPLRSTASREAIYGPVSGDLVRVEDLLRSVKPSDFPFLARIIDYVLEAGGKRVRPALALLAGSFGRYDLDLLVPLAASIELLHSATLVHDDVIDAAPTRRGRATANSLVDNAATVMVGDYMFAHAAELVARTGNIEVIRLFARTLMEMATGELHQDMSAYSYGQSTREYFNRIYGKTASLFATAAQGGAMIGGAPVEWSDALRTYGENIGMAFQIVDDILDFSGDATEMGKPAGSDLMQGTLTLPALLLIERNPGNNPVKRYFSSNRGKAENLRRALDMIQESNVLEESFEVAFDFRARALAALEVLPASEPRDSLTDIAYWVTQRRA